LQGFPTPLQRLFLHFLDFPSLEEVGMSRRPAACTREARLALRLALLAAEEVLIPAAAYVESPLCRTITNEFSDLFDRGCIRLASILRAIAA